MSRTYRKRICFFVFRGIVPNITDAKGPVLHVKISRLGRKLSASLKTQCGQVLPRLFAYTKGPGAYREIFTPVSYFLAGFFQVKGIIDLVHADFPASGKLVFNQRF